MENQAVYLKQDVVAEPLFNQWYAWSYLISPPSAAMYVENLHIKTMQSFITAPQVHISALKNPKMTGGPFINYGADRVADIKLLLEKTKKSQLLELSKAIKELKVLLSKAEGYSLEPLYQEVPEALRGYVELIYDLDNRSAFRFLEGLLYHSPYYDVSSQSIALSVIDSDDRPFALSTPRIEDENSLHLQIPFHASVLDELFRMHHQPAPREEIRKKLGIPIVKEALFNSFFTEEAPLSHSAAITNDDVRIRYFGHACLLIETREVTILCDPLLSYRHAKAGDSYTLVDLPETIDYILITHNHQDHCMFETLLQLRHKTKTVIVPKNNGGELVDPSLKLVLQNIGFKDVREIDVMETLEFNGGFIQGFPFLGEHGDLSILTKMAYHIQAQGRSVLIAADSNNIEPRIYEHLQRILKSGIDILFLGMECEGAPISWIYSPLLTQPLPRKMDQSRRLNGSDCERAIGIVDTLQPQQVYVYAMGQEPWLSFIMATHYTAQSPAIVESNKLIELCRDRGITAERLCEQKEILLTP